MTECGGFFCDVVKSLQLLTDNSTVQSLVCNLSQEKIFQVIANENFRPNMSNSLLIETLVLFFLSRNGGDKVPVGGSGSLIGQ